MQKPKIRVFKNEVLGHLSSWIGQISLILRIYAAGSSYFLVIGSWGIQEDPDGMIDWMARWLSDRLTGRLGDWHLDWRRAAGLGARLQSANSGSVCQLKIWRTALTIFLIFGMNVSYYKTKKRTGPFFREKSGSFNNHDFVFLNDPISFRPFSWVWSIGTVRYCIFW